MRQRGYQRTLWGGGGRYRPAIIETPTGRFILVGTIPEELADRTYATREEAEEALARALQAFGAR